MTVRKKCFIGFDGFTDEIIEAVDKREGINHYTRIETIEQFSERIRTAAGKSGNIEWVVKQKKIGGNAPILALALLEGGHQITFAGMVGSNAIEPLFEPLTSRCEKVYPLAPSSHSDAIEFRDGKIIFGKLDTINQVTCKLIKEKIGLDTLRKTLNETDLLVCANWTMLYMMTDFWKMLKEDIVPYFDTRERWLFVDLADPKKRTDEHIREGMEALANLQPPYKVILGLNESEYQRLKKFPLNFERIVIHNPKNARSLSGCAVEAPYMEKPLLTTGAGDNFNAGYCNALLNGLSEEECLRFAVATSGYYVRYGKSPTTHELNDFLNKWKI